MKEFVSDLDTQFLTAAAREQVLHGFNATAAAFPRERLIHELFEDQVRRTPAAVALVFEQRSLTYAALNAKANELAHHLRDRGVGPDQVVGLCVTRGFEMVVGMLGILKAGGAYVPLDPAYPAERLAYMLADAAPRILLTQQAVRSALLGAKQEVIEIDGDWSTSATRDDSDLEPGLLGLTSLNLAYVIYTSGSTGQPKGAMNEHRGMVNRIVAQRDIEAFSASDICCQKTSISFVDAVFETFGALCNGLPLVILSADAVSDSEKMALLIAQHRVTQLITVPSLARSMLENAQVMRNLTGLRNWTLSGEEVAADLLIKLQRRLPECSFITLYGASEVSSDATYYKASDFAGERVPLGRPVPNTRIYVLDQRGEPVHVGVTGEIHVGGVGVGRGYLNRPELTAARFVTDPFADEPLCRLYKTGDLGRWRADGVLEYQGRNDHQIKIRGFRVELGEIEARLLSQPQVREAVVVAREDLPGTKSLAAYVTLRNEGDAKDTGSARIEPLRTHLKNVLPEYMVPTAFVVMTTLPRTPNGKLDRRALPAPGLDAYATKHYEAPLGQAEALLAQIWQQLLRLPRVGRQDKFFDLGGHSLLVMQMREALRRGGLFAEVRAVYANPTLSELASTLKDAAHVQDAVPPNLIPPECAVITPEMLPLIALDPEQIERIVRSVPGGASNVQDIYPLAPLQEGILFHHLLNAQAGDPYILTTLMSLGSRKKLDDLIGALQGVIDRHDALRTAVLWEQLPRPVQVVYRRLALPVEELVLDRARDPVNELVERMRPERQRMDLRQAPLLRLQVAADSQGDRWYALLQTHHLICDNESLETMLAEVATHLEGQAQTLPPPVAYRNHVAQALTHVGAAEAEAFFRSRLEDITEPTAPYGLVNVHGDGSQVGKFHATLEPALARDLRVRARRFGVSAATLFHAAWALAISQTSGRDDVVFGSVLLGRLQGSAGAQRTLGMFINTLPLRLRLQGVTARALVEQTHRELAELLNHEQAPLAVAQRCSGVRGSVPLFTALLNYLHATPRPEPGHSVIPGVEILANHEWTNYPVVLSVEDHGEGFVLTTQTDRRIDPSRMMGYVTTGLRSLVEALADTPEKAALALDILPVSERTELLDGFNATQAEYPQEKLVHELFEEQVARTPAALAVICGAQQLTYSQLNDRANQLAHALRSRGVAPDERVGLYVERSVEMIVGMLGILKAGGAYLPLDITYPTERLRHMLEDSAPVVVVTQERLLKGLPATEARVISLDGDESTLALEAGSNPVRSGLGLHSRHLAYVIYTSGSTGTPKGVAIEHHTVINLIQWHCRAFDLRAGSYSSCVAAVGFDAAGWEIWPTLSVGATLALASGEVTGDAEALLAWWASQPLDVSFLPTPLAELVFSRNIHHPTLRTLLVGGDRLRSRPAGLSYALINNYGPTESTVVATSDRIHDTDAVLHIGRPIANTRIYLLDPQHRLVPVGVAGEMYIGGAGLARGYLNRAELTAERFIHDPFSAQSCGRMYRTGDLARWQADGTIEFLGRNDEQVKIRGLRIELGEIEAQLAGHEQVRDVVVIAREDVPGEKRLVAYVIPADTAGLGPALSAEVLRTHLEPVLPGYMVPGAFVLLEQFPLTPNGKLDRRALPAPEAGAYAIRQYEAPQGETEELLAGVWQELLRVERVGRQDNFFELGGHSLLIVQMLERLRRVGLSTGVRRVFDSPTLMDLAALLTREAVRQFAVPPNLIPSGCGFITPQMLPLVELEPEHIARIVQAVPGGAANIQDIYPLVPLQEGILFHHLLDAEGGDTYVLATVLCLPSRQRLDELIAAFQGVIDRHDVLRTAILWEQLPRPVQVVYRHATLHVQNVALDCDRDLEEQVKEWIKPERQRLDLRQAPLLRLQVAQHASTGYWYVLLQVHHMTCDHVTLEIVIAEIVAHLEGRQALLPESVPFRNHVAQALAYAGDHDAEAFFRGKLADISEPTAPFGLLDVLGDGSRVTEASEAFEPLLAKRVRVQARRLGVSVATLFHAAWGLVVGRTSARDEVVFGTVLLGRLQGSAGAQRILGMFINTLPLRIQLRDVTVRELVEQTQRELVELLNHEQASLAAAQRCSGIAGSTPLFSALLNYRHSAPTADGGWASAPGISVLADQERTNYPITLSVDDLSEGFILTAQTDERVEPLRITGYLRTAVQSLVEALESAPQTPALALSILPESERQQVLESFNATAPVHPKAGLVHELFEEQVRQTPDAVAVVYAEESLTYSELNSRSNRLARYLQTRGVGPDRLVAICVERNLEMIVGLLGILKAGGAYVPLDPSYPAERLHYMLQDAAPQVVLTQDKLRTALPETAAEIITLDAQLTEIAEYADGNLVRGESEQTPQSLAYVIYTSGSTGRPKGTAMAHRPLVNLIEWHRQSVAADVGQRVLQFAALSFDVAFQEIFSTVCTGGTLVLLDEWIRRDARALADLLSTRAVERLFVPPLMLQSLSEYCQAATTVPTALRDVITAGEQLRVTPEIASFFKRLPGCRLHNHYGPTETHVVTALTLTGDASEWPSLPAIGRPIANARLYVLDDRRQPAPAGVQGEIFVGGVCVARGYHGKAELTAERFVEDRLSQEPGAKMYRTGDLGRWRADGVLEYLGRNDQQVKIRGFRVELGEIEAQLTRHEKVKEAVVIAREDVPGAKRLVAYITRRDDSGPSVEELRANLKTLLPDHMIPSAYVMLESLPLTPNGKLNRRALPAPDLGAYVSRQYDPPQGEIEAALAGIWQGLLRVERVGRQDNFFELGGHSLLMVQMMERLRRVGLSARVRSVYESPTLAALAVTLAGEPAEAVEIPPNLIPVGCEHITPRMLPLVALEPMHIDRIVRAVPGGAANIKDIYPLAPLQEGILFHHLLNEQGGDTYVLPTLLSVPSPQKLEEFIGALQRVIDRHDVLRSAVLWEQLPQPVQVVYRHTDLPVEELVLDPERDPVEQLKALMTPERQKLNLRRAPLMRLQVAAAAEGSQRYVLMQLHHLLCDHESLEHMLAEVMAVIEGRADLLPEPAPYRNHVAQSLAYARANDADAFFRGKLGGIDETTAPFGLLNVHGNGTQVDVARQAFEPALARQVRSQARRFGVSAATLFHAAWALVVARTSAREDVVFGSVLLGRLQGTAGAQRTLGMFINTLPLRLQLQHVTVKELLEHTQRELIELLNHEQASLSAAQRCSGVGGSKPLFTAILNYRHSAADLDDALARAAGVTLVAEIGWTNYPVMLSVDDTGIGFTVTADTDRRVDPRRIVEYIYTAMQSLVEALEEAPQTPALALMVLPESERRQIVDGFNATRVTHPRERLVHELFEEQVRHTPDIVAVERDGQRLTYAQLNGRANQLARYLLSQGVSPGQPVGICAGRSPEMVVGLLAILKAGAAYIPLDPNYPSERLRHMLDDAAPRVVLTQQELLPALAGTSAELISLDGKWRELEGHIKEDLSATELGLTAENPVYVIYTSGSTGKPKGTAMSHRSMVNLIEWHPTGLGDVAGQRVLQFAALSFDVAFQEIFTTLCGGGTLVLLDEWLRRDAFSLAEFLGSRSIDRLFVPPLMLQSLAEHWMTAKSVPAALRDVIAAGEQLRIGPEIAALFEPLPACRLHNHYGPTETHVVTALTLTGDPTAWPTYPTIGKPISNVRMYVLDPQRQVVPIGVAGEIYIGGAGVALGYLGKPELTAQRFSDDPFSTQRGARLYRTGDLGRWQPDGTLEYLGRNDGQVKIRGYRIELGEIETQLQQHPLVRDAVVIAREDVPGIKRLVAYVVSVDEGGPTAEDLRSHLESMLPDHMIPSAFVMLTSLPQTPSGKLDRRALPAPELSAYVSREYEPPQGEVEETLAVIWQTLLQVERVGRQDNFFELGGHSLLGMKLIARVAEQLQVRLSVVTVFQHPTIEQMATAVESLRDPDIGRPQAARMEFEEGLI